MSRTRFLWLLSLWLLFFAGGTAHAQLLQPFVDPANFDMDFRWFEPIYEPDLISVDRVDPHEGPYFQYSRSTLAVSRPDETDGSDNLGDWTWGNRYDFGYMASGGAGWAFSYYNVHSPGEFFITDFVNRNDEVLVDLLGDPVGPTRDTVNDAEVNSFEANRTWRLHDRNSWLMVEPYVGARYLRVRDQFVQQDSVSFREGAPATFTPNGSLTLLQEDVFTNDDFENQNDLFGGQLGFRATAWRGRWRLITDLRGIACNNFQNRERDLTIETNTRVDLATYDANGNLQNIQVGGVTSSEDRSLSGRNDPSRLVWGGELRIEAAYDFSRNIAVVGGLETLVLADGIGRGTTSLGETFTLFGGTLGISINH